MKEKEQYLWVEKYRPKSVKETILPEDLKATFQTFVDQEVIPNLLLLGGPGMGKTTVAKAMLQQLGCTYITINGSLRGNIDTLRSDIMDFASTMSIYGGRKYIILDEADYINYQSTQPALRNFMEQYSHNCGFILTANYPYKILPALHSRCTVIEFKFTRKVARHLLTRACSILKNEGVDYEEPVVAALIAENFPDFRKALNALQGYAARGMIDSGILAQINGPDITPLIEAIKTKNFTEARGWVAKNVDNSTKFIRQLFEYSKTLTPDVAAPFTLILGKYQKRDAIVADKEVNNAALVAEIMVEGLLS